MSLINKLIRKFVVCFPALRQDLLKVENAIVNSRIDVYGNFYIALIAGEDHRFFSHQGVDFLGILRAIYSTFIRFRLQGASTIEQQLVRVITERYEVSLSRKLREALLAMCLGVNFTKIEIARCYLDNGYYGWSMKGMIEACKNLHVDPACASIHGASSVIARLKYPQQKVMNPRNWICINKRTSRIVRRSQRFVDGRLNKNVKVVFDNLSRMPLMAVEARINTVADMET